MDYVNAQVSERPGVGRDREPRVREVDAWLHSGCRPLEGGAMRRRKGLWIGLALAFAAVVAAGGYYYWRVALPSRGQAAAEPTIQKGTAGRGDIVVSVDGTATLVPTTVEVGFDAGGYVSEVLVEVGDVVEEGDVIARLETDDLENAVLDADIRLRKARLTLEELTAEPSEAEVTDAENAIQSAQDALLVAQFSYNSTLNSNLDAAVRARQIQYHYDVDRFYAIQADADGSEADQARLASAWDARARSEADLATAVEDANIEQISASEQVERATAESHPGRAAAQRSECRPVRGVGTPGSAFGDPG